MFTDIEGSTRRWESDADAMRAALLKHDGVLRTAIEKHEGFLFSHTGDGVVAAFASPGSAVDAAVAAQRALQLPGQMDLATGLQAVCIECKRVNPCHAPRLTPAPSSTDSPPSTPCCSPYGVELVVSASRGIDLRTTASGPDV